MKNKKIISVFAKTLICSLLIASVNTNAQNTNYNKSNIQIQNNNQNQNNNQIQNNNAGSTNEQNNAINNPYTTVPPDSAGHLRYNETNENTHPTQTGAFEQQQQVRQQSGQNQATIPPNAAGPDTNVHRITQNGNFTNNASDTTIQKSDKRKNNNTTLTGSPATIAPEIKDTIK